MNVAKVILLNPAKNIVDMETEGWMLGGSLLTLREGKAAKAKDGDYVFGRLLYDVLPPGCLPVHEETKVRKNEDEK